MLDLGWSRCCTKRKASKSKRATLERPLLVTVVLCATEQLAGISDSVSRWCKTDLSLWGVFFNLRLCISIPSKEVVLLCLRHVVSGRCSKAVIQQDIETGLWQFKWLALWALLFSVGNNSSVQITTYLDSFCLLSCQVCSLDLHVDPGSQL